jgi:hypothetical protein
MLNRSGSIFIIIFALTSVLTAGISGKITGIITDKDGEILSGVNVIIANSDHGAATNQDGIFFILNVPPGTHTLNISSIGYKLLTIQNVLVQTDKTTRVEGRLDLEVLEGQSVTVEAVRPKVELDLTASKQVISGDELNNSWGSDVEEILSDLIGVNVNGGIRGGFGLDVAYHVDGMDMRDAASNTNFTGINLSTIESLEMLSGGWNAEYGQANGAIINIVTKSSSDHIHGTYSYRMRPAGKYHWGDNIYADDGFMRTIMTTPNFWNPDTTWTTKWIEADTNRFPQTGYNGGTTYFKDMTPEERAAWWTTFINDENTHPYMNYAELAQHETEATLYGPITDKLKFMLSGRYKRGINRFPSPLQYNPDYMIQGSFNWALNNNTSIAASLVFTGFENTGSPKTNYASTEDTFHNNSFMSFVDSPYSRWVFWMHGTSSSSSWTIRAPEYASLFNSQIKVTHMFSDRTFAEFVLQKSSMNYEMHYREIMRSAYYDDLEIKSDAVSIYPEIPTTIVSSLKWDYPGDIWYNKVTTDNTNAKIDLASQITNNHYIKSGLLLSFLSVSKDLHDHQSGGDAYFGHFTDLSETRANPYEGAFYLQDKIEFYDMIMNAGIRLDFFNPNMNVSENGFDPLMISDTTIGHTGPIGHISWDPDGGGEGYVTTKTRWAVSPRLGISHPINENTVFHFSYGKFNQRPPWQKIVAPPVVRTEQLPTAEEGGTSELNLNPDSVLVYYNFYTHIVPNRALTFETMTQYEVGFETALPGGFVLDITGYYKDAYNLTSRGIDQGPGSYNISNTGGPVMARMFGDPRSKDGRAFGTYQGYFNTFLNGAWAEAKGIEASLSSRFKIFNFKLNYTNSYLLTGEYHLSEIVKEWEDGTKLGRDVYEGANNADNGINGDDDDTWNPRNSARLGVYLSTPKFFGPSVAGIHLLGGVNITTSTTWSEGQRYTYYPLGYTGMQTPRNKIWKSKWNTNLNVSKDFFLHRNIICTMGVSTTNLFNKKHLRLPSTSNREAYFEEGRLPVNNKTQEPLVWNYYYNQPRITNIFLKINF